MSNKEQGLIMDNRIFLRIAVATGGLLLIPLIAMQFTAEVDWTFSDFVVMGLLLFTAGSLFVLLARRVPGNRRLLTGAVVLVGFLWIWGELAVGIFTNRGS
jgi:hypothetical protein